MAFPGNLGKVQVAEQSGWGTAQTVFDATLHTVECEVVIPTLIQEALRTNAMRGTFNAQRVVAGAKSGTTVSLSMPLHGWSATTPAADPTSSNAFVDSILMTAALGGVAYTTAAFGATTDSSPGSAATTAFTGGEGSALTLGSALLVPKSGGHSVGFASTVSTDDITWRVPLSATATADADCYGSINTYLANGSPANGLTMVYLGAESSSKIVLYDGCVTRAKMILSPGQQPKLEADLHFGAWTLSGSGGDPGQFAYTLPQLPAAISNNGARFMVDGSAVEAGTVEIEVTLDAQPVLSHAGPEGVASYAIANREVTMTVESAASALTTATVGAPGDAVNAIQCTLNTTAGRSVAVLIASGQLEEIRTIGDSNGLVALTSTYRAATFDDDGTADVVGTAPADTLVRVAWL